MSGWKPQLYEVEDMLVKLFEISHFPIQWSHSNSLKWGCLFFLYSVESTLVFSYEMSPSLYTIDPALVESYEMRSHLYIVSSQLSNNMKWIHLCIPWSLL